MNIVNNANFINHSLYHFKEKRNCYRKNRYYSQKYSSDLYEAYFSGNIEKSFEWKQFIKEKKVIAPHQNLPLWPSDKTKTIESLVKYILRKPHSFIFNRRDLLGLSQLILRTNFNDIHLTFDDLKYFEKLVDRGKLLVKPAFSQKAHKRFSQEHLSTSVLTTAEKKAIHVYTATFSNPINKMLNGQLEELITSIPEKIDTIIKASLLYATVLVSSLNKLESDDFPAWITESQAKYVYRLENLKKEQIENRKESLGKILIQRKCISASILGPVEEGLLLGEKRKNVAILIEMSKKVKNIMPFSAFGTFEREVLIPPGYIQWLNYKECKKSNMTFFICKFIE